MTFDMTTVSPLPGRTEEYFLGTRHDLTEGTTTVKGVVTSAVRRHDGRFDLSLTQTA